MTLCNVYVRGTNGTGVGESIKASWEGPCALRTGQELERALRPAGKDRVRLAKS